MSELKCATQVEDLVADAEQKQQMDLHSNTVLARLQVCIFVCVFFPRVVSACVCPFVYAGVYVCLRLRIWGEVGGWGRDPKQCTGRD